MKISKKYIRFSFMIIVISVLTITSCTEDIVDNPVSNVPPNTGLFLYPDSTISQQPSRLRVHWWGDDPDGLIAGFFIKWDGISTAWTFTTSNDSLFSLPIGSSDTTYNFLVAAADKQGNGIHDARVFQNGIDFGPEPFTDQNGNGVYDSGEPFIDIGLIDPSPASTLFPIKNTPPFIGWNELSFLPDTSFPVTTISWTASDLDGDESITKIKVALNDTSNFISLSGSVRLITLRGINLNSPNPEVEVLINGSPQDIHVEKLQGLKLNDNNIIYVQAEDFSGASSNLIQLPDTSSTWYVKKPKGNVLVVDDYSGGTTDLQASQFYNSTFSSIGSGALAGKFDVFDLAKNPIPFENVTILETVKLFKYVFWYSASNPSLDLLNIVTEKFNQAGGKIAFSMTFQDSTSSYPVDLSTLQGFLPIDGVSKKVSNGFLLAGAEARPSTGSDYPLLRTSVTISFVRTYVPNSIITESLYDLYGNTGTFYGNVGFRTTQKNLFFIGLPLHQANAGSANVPALLEKVFFEDFGVVP